MAGNLPGVECARRRRSGGWSDAVAAAAANGSTRRPTFCLYAGKNETHHINSAHSQQRSTVYLAYQDEKLGGVAREAKERLDERLKTQRKPHSKRESSKEGKDKDRIVGAGVQAEVFGWRKGKSGSGSKSKRLFSWARLIGWKALEQDECVVCLERFETGETLVHLPCAHRFHTRCLGPWLQTNAHCPCCRLQIVSHQA